MPDFYPNNFLGLPSELSDLGGADYVILSLPYEVTTSYGKGAKFGPQAIIEASRNMELYDEEVGFEPCRRGIHTTGDLDIHAVDPSKMVEAVRKAVSHYTQLGKFVVALGGEHSLSYPAFLAHQALHGELGVVQIDAHADLRDTYEGTPYNHACVMRRITEKAAGACQIGIRSLSSEEADFLASRPSPWPVLWARECAAGGSWMDKAVESLPEKVYLTIDVDGFDPSLMPCTGTPEPGGLQWYPVLNFISRLMAERTVVGMDIMELAPDRVHFASDFLAARLVYKAIAYHQQGRGH
ncbi:MAG: agmatinase [Acidobacteriota bacterium]